MQAPSRQSSSNPAPRVAAGAPCTSSWFPALLRASSKHCLQGLHLISLIPASSACKGTSWHHCLLPYSLAFYSSVPRLPCPNGWGWALAEEAAPPGPSTAQQRGFPQPRRGKSTEVDEAVSCQSISTAACTEGSPAPAATLLPSHLLSSQPEGAGRNVTLVAKLPGRRKFLGGG